VHATLATGQPWVTTGTGFDVAPLILGIVVLGGLRLARFKIRAWMVPAAMVLGLALDDLADASGDSMLSAVALLVAVSCAASLRRTNIRKNLPPAV
jgi:hypothetical protein